MTESDVRHPKESHGAQPVRPDPRPLRARPRAVAIHVPPMAIGATWIWLLVAGG